MSELTQPITGLSANDPVPGAYIEVKFAQGELAGDPSTPSVLLIGPKLASGSATANTQVYLLTGAEDAADKGGEGTPVHRMAKRFSEVCRSAPLYAVFVTEATGTVAANRITITGAATSGTGVITYTLAGEKIEVGVAKTTTATAAANALVAEVNLQSHWPVTAVKGTGATVDVKCRVKGTNGNATRHRVSISAGTGMAVTAATATLTGGTGVETYTTPLDTIEGTRYNYIVPYTNLQGTSDTRVAAVKAQILAQALPIEGIRQQVIIAHTGTQATAGTFTANSPGNHPRIQTAWQEKSEWEPAEVAAQLAAVRYNEEVPNPVKNYNGYGKGVNDLWNVPAQYAEADKPTRSEISAAISAGLTPIAANGTRTYIVRSCTSSTDVRVRDTSKVTTADRFADDLGARYLSQWTDANLQDDPADDNVQVAPKVLTPKRLKSLTIVPLYIRYANAGWLDSDKTFDATNGDITACATGIDPVNGTRINARIPIHVIKHAHQFAALVSENSAA